MYSYIRTDPFWNVSALHNLNDTRKWQLNFLLFVLFFLSFFVKKFSFRPNFCRTPVRKLMCTTNSKTPILLGSGLQLSFNVDSLRMTEDDNSSESFKGNCIEQAVWMPSTLPQRTTHPWHRFQVRQIQTSNERLRTRWKNLFNLKFMEQEFSAVNDFIYPFGSMTTFSSILFFFRWQWLNGKAV